MKLKSTQFNFVNSEKGPWDETEDWNTKMEDGATFFSHEEDGKEFTPSDQAINNIMDFARSYHTFQSRSLKFIDLYVN